MKKLLLIAIFAVFLCAVGLYALTLRGVPGNPTLKQIDQLTYPSSPFESSHERAPYVLILSIVNNHTFSLTKDLADVGAPDVGYYKGKFYIFFPPGLSLLALPFYILGNHFGYAQLFTYAVMPVFGLLALIMLYKICRDIFKMPVWTSLLVILTFGFATTSWSYAVTIYQHIMTAFFILLSFYGVWKFKNGDKLSWLWGSLVWFSYAAAVFIDYPNLFLMAPLMVYFFFSALKITESKKKVTFSFNILFILTSVFFFALTAYHGYFNYKHYGNFTTFSNTLPRYEKGKLNALLSKQEQKKELKVETNAGRKLFAVFNEDRLTNGLNELLFANDKGVFFYSPVLLLAIIGFFLVLKEIKLEHIILLSILFVNLLLYGSFDDPWGGWAYGPRYLIPSMPILALFVGFFLTKFRYKLFGEILFIILFIFSSAIALLGVLTTNIIPPRIEAIPMHLKYYNYIMSIDYIKHNTTGSFIFNQYLSHSITLLQFYIAILVFLVILVNLVTFARYFNKSK